MIRRSFRNHFFNLMFDNFDASADGRGLDYYNQIPYTPAELYCTSVTAEEAEQRFLLNFPVLPADHPESKMRCSFAGNWAIKYPCKGF